MIVFQLGTLSEKSHYSPNLTLDCANGVGGEKMRMLCRFLPEDSLNIQFRNEDGELNHEVGGVCFYFDLRSDYSNY